MHTSSSGPACCVPCLLHKRSLTGAFGPPCTGLLRPRPACRTAQFSWRGSPCGCCTCSSCTSPHCFWRCLSRTFATARTEARTLKLVSSSQPHTLPVLSCASPTTRTHSACLQGQPRAGLSVRSHILPARSATCRPSCALTHFACKVSYMPAFLCAHTSCLQGQPHAGLSVRSHILPTRSATCWPFCALTHLALCPWEEAPLPQTPPQRRGAKVHSRLPSAYSMHEACTCSTSQQLRRASQGESRARRNVHTHALCASPWALPPHSLPPPMYMARPAFILLHTHPFFSHARHGVHCPLLLSTRPPSTLSIPTPVLGASMLPCSLASKCLPTPSAWAQATNHTHPAWVRGI